MAFISRIRKIYRRSIHSQWLDQKIYSILDALTTLYSSVRRYSFPKNYIRRWKLDMLWELYEPETVKIAKEIIKPGMVAVDIGAHIGYFTRIFSTLVGSNGRVLAFEADPENFELLEKNTKHINNVARFNFALCDKSGPIDFYHCVEKAGCNSILPNLPLNFTTKKITVNANTLDAALAQEHITHVDFIKIDIEGGESAAFRGMAKLFQYNIDLAMVVEFSPATIKITGISPLAFLQEFSKQGFDIYAITTRGIFYIDTKDESGFEPFIPPPYHDGSAYNQFVNIICVRGKFANLDLLRASARKPV